MSIAGERHTERRLAAILAADVVSYSRLMGKDEEGTHFALKAVRREVTDPKIGEHRGRIVKTTGDGLLVEFASVVDAVRCAVDIQREMKWRNELNPAQEPIRFRIGINLGDIIIDEDDIFGDGVNVAARLEGLADPGGICVSRIVRDQVRDKLGFGFEDRGPQQVKNIARPVHVFRIVLENDAPAAAARDTRRRPDTAPAFDHAVLGLCEILALTFALPFGEDLYKGTPVAGWHYCYLVIGLIFAVLGPLWPQIQKRMPARLSDILPGRLRVGAPLLAGVAAGAVFFMLKISAGPANPALPVVAEALFFDRNKVALPQSAAASLAREVDFLKENPGASITVRAYCSDDEGVRESPQVLAQLRANQIRDALKADGVRGERIKIENACRPGAGQPAGAGEATQAQNRRVVLIRN